LNHRIDKKRPLGDTGLTWLCGVAIGLFMSKRPNFILFITDQHRADFLGCYGHPVLRTPQRRTAIVRRRRAPTFATPATTRPSHVTRNLNCL
jgi:hypothetical protein